MVIGQQEAVYVTVSDGGVVVLTQESVETGKNVEILIQPENLCHIIASLEVEQEEWEKGNARD